MQICKRDENLLNDDNIDNNTNHGSAIGIFELFGEMSKVMNCDSFFYPFLKIF